ncbi:MAG: hypothetical protein MI923_30305 [Phycisphaerales bacterium]|nr:hypothetical protein [Phycisphaerales bacterium]
MGFWFGILIGVGIGIAGLVGLLLSSSWLLDRLGRKAVEPTPPERDPQLDIELRPEDVPEELRDVVPVARKFGVGCDGLRMEVIEAASQEELSELRDLMERHWFIIQKWIDYTKHPIPDWLVPIMYARIAAEEIDPPAVPPK